MEAVAVADIGPDAGRGQRVVAVAALGLRIDERAGGQDPGRDEHLFLCAR